MHTFTTMCYMGQFNLIFYVPELRKIMETGWRLLKITKLEQRIYSE